MRFPAHGSIATYWINQTLLVELSGTINEEAAQTFRQEIESTAIERGRGNWNRIEWFRGEDVMATPEAFAELDRNLKICAQTGCKAIHLVNAHLLMEKSFMQKCAERQIACFKHENIFDAICAANHGQGH